MTFKTVVSILFLQVTLFTFLNAQKGNVAPGYIVDNEGVKTEGFIQVQKRINNEIKVKFSTKQKAKKFPTYKVKDLSGYGYESTVLNNMKEPIPVWRHFERFELDRPARIISSNSSLLEKVVEGYLTVYLFEYETANDLENPITKRYIIMHNGEELCQIELDNFEEASKALFEGYTSMVNSIGKKQFRFKSMIRLVEDFNYWNENQHDPNIYKMNPKIYSQ